MELHFLITAFVALFVVIDPIGLAPLFVAMTAHQTPQKRRRIAIRATLVGGGILLLFSVFGDTILTVVGISMPAFRIAGGILLFITALDMLFERRQKRREDRADEEDLDEDDPSVFPLAIPLIAGPGAIATLILLVSETENTLGFFAVMLAFFAVMGLVFAMFLVAPWIGTLFGKTGINIVTRLFGMLLAALSVQFVIDGLRGSGLGG